MSGATTALIVKQPEREAEYSPPNSASVEKIKEYISTPQNVFME
jgi:hypothetical protein